MSEQVLLISLLKDHTLATSLSLKEWELVIRQARASGLLAQIYYAVKKNANLDRVPVKALFHMESAHVIASKQHNAVHIEIHHLLSALENTGIQLILLKGAAYISADLEASSGRLLSDIDILIPKIKLAQAEKSLALKGWFSSPHDAYEEKYYRKWMHEIPPMTQVIRQSSLDVHHTILPPTAKYNPDPLKLFERAIKCADGKTFILSPEDMVIHSATHLFHEGEFNHGLRDLVDITTLIKEFSLLDASFWDKLTTRSFELHLSKPLYYALRYCEKILNLPVPEKNNICISKAQPNKAVLAIMDFLFIRALVPDHSSCNVTCTGFSRWALYIRSHYLRMPLHLLIPHLTRKSWKKHVGSSTLQKTQIEAHHADDLQKNT